VNVLYCQPIPYHEREPAGLPSAQQFVCHSHKPQKSQAKRLCDGGVCKVRRQAGDAASVRRLEKFMARLPIARSSLAEHAASLGCAAGLTAAVTLLSAVLGWLQAIIAAGSAAAIFFWLCPPYLLGWRAGVAPWTSRLPDRLGQQQKPG
jgi:hypothetical protein